MNLNMHSIGRYLARSPAAPAVIYISLVLGLFCVALLLVGDLAQKFSEVNSIAQQQRNSTTLAIVGFPTGSLPEASPFLGGQSVTVASAALLQQLVGAITRVGGTVSSSNIEQERQDSDDRLVKVVANCELDQAALQQLLYDLEAGMPFLFVDQLVVTRPLTEGERMQVQLGVSGLWLDEKS